VVCACLQRDVWHPITASPAAGEPREIYGRFHTFARKAGGRSTLRWGRRRHWGGVRRRHRDRR